CGGNTNIVTATGTSSCGTLATGTATNTCLVTESVCLAVTKTCQTAVVGQSQLISGTVTNCGNVALTNITVSDNIAGAITNGVTLAPGAAFPLHDALPTSCGGNTNIVTATGTSSCGTLATGTATNTCLVTESVCLAVTKTCQTAVVGQSQLISGTVTNCGNVALTNITVSDNIAGAITNGVTLAPGAAFPLHDALPTSCGGNTNIVTATGTSSCGTLATGTATNTCLVTESVCLAVTKTCQTAVVGQSQLISGTVTNCGNVALTNITVSDNIAGAITNGVTLAPGAAFPLHDALPTTCGGNTNIVTATGTSSCGTLATGTATNTCLVTESVCLAVTKTCQTAVVGQSQLISGTVTNCGNVTLTNLNSSHIIAGPITTGVTLAPGALSLHDALPTSTCGGNTNIVTATGTSGCGTVATGTATNTCLVTESVCLAVTKTCQTAVAGQPQLISGTVTNC